jgi:hypothetical protein
MATTATKEAGARRIIWRRLTIWLYLRWLYEHYDPRTL